MLDLQPALGAPPPSEGRFGLALAGGGPLGAFFEVGALHAIDESFDGFSLTELDMYVGVSAGAMISAGLANRINTADMGAVFIHNASPEFPMHPSMFVRPAIREYFGRLSMVPGLGREILLQYLRDPGTEWTEFLEPLGRLVPAGLCDNRPLEAFLAKLFTSEDRTNDFRELGTRLYVIATELDSGYAVRFGDQSHDHVPISKAVQASSALPGLYPAVKIDGHNYVDGGLMRTMNASILLDAGVDFIVCVNPLVAFDASSAPLDKNRVDRSFDLWRGGLPVVMGQTFRALIQSRMLVGHRTYKQEYPDTDVLLFEPDRSDVEMFFQNVFRYSDRERLVEHAYQHTRRDLRTHADALEKILERHSIRLRRDRLEDESRTFLKAVRERRRRFKPVTGDLHRTLDRLESALNSLH